MLYKLYKPQRPQLKKLPSVTQCKHTSVAFGFLCSTLASVDRNALKCEFFQHVQEAERMEVLLLEKNLLVLE